MSDCTHPNNDIEKQLKSIYALNTSKTIFRLDKGPYIDLLEKLGNPHLNLPPTIHVAGTNGKGSTIAFLKSLFEADGKTVHVYTSPHLIKFNERITLAGTHIDDETLLHYLDIIDTANAGASITFFEYTTALAFKAFADNPADVLLLETGLGGRLDCTNVIKNPIATIITSIGYDHMDWLGTDINTIAGEKAGIMKPNALCFIAPQTHDVNDVFKHKANAVGCDIHFVERMDDLPPLGLVGDHQKDNASTALTVIASISKGGNMNALSQTYWPARMEKIYPRLDRGSSQKECPEIWFDCGHNADGAKTIGTQLKTWKSENLSRPIHLILGLGTDKNPHDFIAPLARYIDSITCVDLMNARNPQSGVDLASKLNDDFNPSTAETVKQAISALPKDNGIIMITGSLYLYETAIIACQSFL